MSHNHQWDGHSSLLISLFHTLSSIRCEICGYQCRQRASLNWHMKKHTPEAHYNFTCEFCDKRFEKLDSVKFHKLKSHPDKQATWGAATLLLELNESRSSGTKGRLPVKKQTLLCCLSCFSWEGWGLTLTAVQDTSCLRVQAQTQNWPFANNPSLINLILFYFIFTEPDNSPWGELLLFQGRPDNKIQHGHFQHQNWTQQLCQTLHLSTCWSVHSCSNSDSPEIKTNLFI